MSNEHNARDGLCPAFHRTDPADGGVYRTSKCGRFEMSEGGYWGGVRPTTFTIRHAKSGLQWKGDSQRDAMERLDLALDRLLCRHAERLAAERAELQHAKGVYRCRPEDLGLSTFAPEEFD